MFNYTLQSAHLAAFLNFNWLFILRWYKVTPKNTLCRIFNAKVMNM